MTTDPNAERIIGIFGALSPEDREEQLMLARIRAYVRHLNGKTVSVKGHDRYRKDEAGSRRSSATSAKQSPKPSSFSQVYRMAQEYQQKLRKGNMSDAERASYRLRLISALRKDNSPLVNRFASDVSSRGYSPSSRRNDFARIVLEYMRALRAGKFDVTVKATDSSEDVVALVESDVRTYVRRSKWGTVGKVKAHTRTTKGIADPEKAGTSDSKHTHPVSVRDRIEFRRYWLAKLPKMTESEIRKVYEFHLARRHSIAPAASAEDKARADIVAKLAMAELIRRRRQSSKS